MKKIILSTLEEKLLQFLEKHFDGEAAKRAAEVILWAELHNKEGQGLLKLAGTEPLQNVKPIAPLTIKERTPISAHIQANKQPSFYAAQVATDIAIQKAQDHGVAFVGVNGIFSSVGALGFYVERMAKADLIGLVMARSPGTTAPFSTTTPLFGTNPLAVGFPTLDEPLVFDMATSAITWYELVLAKMQGKNIPENVAIDKTGELTTNPADAMKGALLPFDRSYKSSGLSMLVEIMSGPLVSASYCDFETFDKDWGLFVLAFKPDLLADLKDFKFQCSDLIKIIRAQPATNQEAVRLPGDAGRKFAKKTLERGAVEIDSAVAELIGL